MRDGCIVCGRFATSEIAINGGGEHIVQLVGHDHPCEPPVPKAPAPGVARLDADPEIRGLLIVGDPEIGTGRFRIVCSRELDGGEIEEVEAVGTPVEVPAEAPSPN